MHYNNTKCCDDPKYAGSKIFDICETCGHMTGIGSDAPPIKTPENFVGPDWDEFQEDIKNIQPPTYLNEPHDEECLKSLMGQFKIFDKMCESQRQISEHIRLNGSLTDYKLPEGITFEKPI